MAKHLIQTNRELEGKLQTLFANFSLSGVPYSDIEELIVDLVEDAVDVWLDKQAWKISKE